MENVENLRILGLYFNKKYLWNEHVNLLCTSLKSRLNIIKCLSNHKLECNVNSLLNIVRSIILAKIDYGLPIYGATSKTNLNKIKSVYHNSIRLALGAYRSTPINNLMAESGFQHLTDRIEFITARSLINVVHSDRCELSKLAKYKINRKRNQKKSSALQRIILASQEINLNPIPISKRPLRCPPWNFPANSIIMDLSEFKKGATNPEVYKQMYLTIKAQHQTWNALFTDGSKTESSTSFSVIDENNTVISMFLLPNHSSIFCAEAEGVLCAVRHAEKLRSRHIIFTDSLSVTTAILNPNNRDYTISLIRDILTSYTNIKICWVPSHIGIQGNSYADEAARFATTSPLYIMPSYNKNDLKNCVKNWNNLKMKTKWNAYEHHYKQFNANLSRIAYPSTVPRKQTINFTRCRLGHTRATHPFDNMNPICKFCDEEIFTIKHFLEDCPIINGIKETRNIPTNLYEVLAKIDPVNIQIFNNFLQQLFMVYEI